ncbi:hypothetical protein K7X08_013358 [Anisodus acutangulus]|uniref:DUF7356 domain-containing protein n=1 Tax=Anisodus acutangulus TaxID=402998 RepID=A0A9Q1RHA8_9SOLA|nr:hypothetical protein K7X08_013358 [Anisodus acutangulus]
MMLPCSNGDALLIAYVAATDLEINGAEKAGEDAVILSSNSSVIEKLDQIIMNRKKDVHLENDSSSNEKKTVKAGDRRKMNNNSSDSVGELTNVGDQNKLNEAEVEKKRNDNSSERDDGKEDIKEAEKQEKANNSSTEKQGEKGKILPDGIESREELLITRKENFHGEECDSSYSCTIEEQALVACLRVPGNDSPDLSLLVQNKGKDTARISIMAPKFVKLEQNQIELQGKENKKVSISGGNDNFIILKAGDGREKKAGKISLDECSSNAFFSSTFFSSTCNVGIFYGEIFISTEMLSQMLVLMLIIVTGQFWGYYTKLMTGNDEHNATLWCV